MKRIIFSLLTVWMSVTAFAQANGAATQQFFQLPIVPDSIETFQRKCDYMVTHYWDFCDLKKAFSSPDKMTDAFEMYIGFMPYASAKDVFDSVDKFMDNISKQPDNVMFITRLAERFLLSDSSEYHSEELYTRFLDNALKVKKLNKADRTALERQAAIFHNSQEGMIAPGFDFTTIDGTKARFEPDGETFATVLMFVVPGNTASDMARLRLDADIKTSQLIKAGMVKIYCIAVEEGNGKLTCPEGWNAGYAPTITETYGVPYVPMFYILNSDGKILKKSPELDGLLAVMQQLRLPRKKRATDAATSSPDSTDQNNE